MVKQVVQDVMELRITFNQKTGQTQVTGPIDNRMLCYGMLETAKEIVLKRGLGAETKHSKLVIPQLNIGPNGL